MTTTGFVVRSITVDSNSSTILDFTANPPVSPCHNVRSSDAFDPKYIETLDLKAAPSVYASLNNYIQFRFDESRSAIDTEVLLERKAVANLLACGRYVDSLHSSDPAADPPIFASLNFPHTIQNHYDMSLEL